MFLVGVVLSEVQSEVGIATVVQGAKDEPADGSSFGASLRRFHGEDGISLRIGSGASYELQAFR